MAAITFDDLPQAPHGVRFDDLPDASPVAFVPSPSASPSAGTAVEQSNTVRQPVNRVIEAASADAITPEQQAALDATDAGLNALSGPGSIMWGAHNLAQQNMEARLAAGQHEADQEMEDFLAGRPVKTETGESKLPPLSREMLAKADPTMGQYAGAAAVEQNIEPLNLGHVKAVFPIYKASFEAPMIQLPKPEGSGVGAGIVRGLETGAEGLTSPENVALMATLAGAPATIGRIASAAFAAMMAKEVPGQLKEAYNAPTAGEAAERYTGAAISTLFSALATRHAIKGSEPSTLGLKESGQIIAGAPTAALEAAMLDPKISARLHPKAVRLIASELGNRKAAVVHQASPLASAEAAKLLAELEARQLEIASRKQPATLPKPPNALPISTAAKVGSHEIGNEGAGRQEESRGVGQGEQRQVSPAASEEKEVIPAATVAPVVSPPNAPIETVPATTEAAKATSEAARPAETPAQEPPAAEQVAKVPGRGVEGFQPPIPPRLTSAKGMTPEEKAAHFDAHMNAVSDYNFALVNWEQSLPPNQGLIFEVGDNLIHLVTRDPNGGWRTTTISKIDKMPMGHVEHRTRLEAVKEETHSTRLEKIPFEVQPLTPEMMRWALEELGSTESQRNPTLPGNAARVVSKLESSAATSRGIRPALKDSSGAVVAQGEPGQVHGDVIAKAQADLPPELTGDALDAAMKAIDKHERIFVDEAGNPMDRVDAWNAAKAAGEIKQSALDAVERGERKAELQSEDLIAHVPKEAAPKPPSAPTQPPEPTSSAAATAGAEPLTPEHRAAMSSIFDTVPEDIAEEAKPAEPEPKKRRKISAGSFEENPLVDFILGSIGKILSKSGAKKKWGAEKFANNSELWEEAPRFGDPRHNKIYGPNGVTPDEAVGMLSDAGLLKPDASVHDMWAELQTISDSSRRIDAQERARTVNEKEAGAQARRFEAAAFKAEPGDEAVSVSELQVGDTVMIDKETLTVTDIDADTHDVTLSDGKHFGVQSVEDGKVLYVEGKTQVERADPLADFPEIDPIADAAKLDTDKKVETYAADNQLLESKPAASLPPKTPPTPEQKGPGGAPQAPASEVPAELTPAQKLRAKLEDLAQELAFVREEGDDATAASISRVIGKLRKDLAAAEEAEKAPAPAPQAAPTELWQVTREHAGGDLVAHREAVKQAVSEGKPVPDAVVEQYSPRKWADDELRRRRKEEKAKAKEPLPETPTLEGELLATETVNIGTIAHVSNEEAGTLVRVGGQVVAKLNRNAKGEFTPELNEHGAKLTEAQKALVGDAAADYTKTVRAAELKAKLAKPLAAADLITQTDMLEQGLSDTPLFEQNPVKQPDKVQKALSKLIDKLKTDKDQLFFDPLLIQTFGKPALRLLVKTVKVAYDTGKTVAEAVQAGIDYLRSLGQPFDEKLVWDYYKPHMEMEAEAVKVARTEREQREAAKSPPQGSTQSAPEAAASQSSQAQAEPTAPPAPLQPESPGRIVALRMAFTDAQRERMGLPEWVKPEALTNQAAWERAQTILAENPNSGSQLVAEMNKMPRPLEPHEKAILLYEEGMRDTEYHAAIDAVNAAATPGEHLSATVRLNLARDANKEFYDAARASGRASGQSLQAHKMALDTETWTLARMEAAIQARMKFGEKLHDGKHEAQLKEIEKLQYALDAARKTIADQEAAAKDANVAGLLESVLADIKRARQSKKAGESLVDFGRKMEDEARARLKARHGGKMFTGLDPRDLLDHAQIGASWIIQGAGNLALFTVKLVATYGPSAKPYASEIYEASKQQKEIFETSHAAARTPKPKPTTADILKGAKPGEPIDQKTVYDLVRARVEAEPEMEISREKIAEIMDDIAGELQKAQPGITGNEVRDIFDQYGQEIHPSKEQINVKMRELRGSSLLISKLMGQLKEGFVRKTGKHRDKPTVLDRELLKELSRTMREMGLPPEHVEGMLKTAHDARATRLKNAIEDTQRQIEQGKRTPKTPGVEWTPEELALKEQLGALKDKLDEMLNEPDSDELARLMDRIETVTDKLATGKIEAKGKSQNVPTKAVSEARDQLTALNNELAARRKAKRDLDNPPKSEDERKLKALEKEEEKLAEQIQTGRIDAKTGKPTADTKEVAEARTRVEALREQIAAMRKAKRDTPENVDARKLESLETRKAELERQVASGLFPQGKPGRPTAATPEQARLQSQIDVLEQRKAEILRSRNPKTPEHIRQLDAILQRLAEAESELAQGHIAARTGKPTVATPEIAQARAELKAINATIAALRKTSAEGIERDLENYKRMIERKRAELQDKIARKDFTKVPRKELSAEKTKAAAAYKADLEKWERMKRAQELKNQNLLQKTLRWSTYFAHEMLLLGGTVGQKLSTAAITTAGLVRPLEEIAGYGLGKALPFMAEKADVEIATSAKSLVKHEATAAADAFLRIISDIGSTMKRGKVDFELEFGKHYDTEMISWVGRMHGCLKTLPARQAFRATFERLSEKYAQRGLDVTDPDVRFSIGTQALAKAIEAKFQDPNLAVKMFKGGIRIAENASPNVGAVTKAVARTEMPVMTVASNITWRAFEHVYGLPIASGRIASQAIMNGLHNTFGKRGADFAIRAMNEMSTEQVESIARQFKRGSVGLGAFLIGAYAYQNLGGFYKEGEKRDKDDIKPEEIRTPYFDIPKEFIHHPIFLTMQAGAATVQVANSRLRIRDEEEQGLVAGGVSAGLSMAEETPFGQTARWTGKLFNSYTRNDAIGSFARTMLGISGPVAWMAKHQDVDAQGEPVKRKAETLTEQLQIGIPYQRQRLERKR